MGLHGKHSNKWPAQSVELSLAQYSTAQLSVAQCGSLTRTMEPGGGAFGGAKAGAAAQDPMAFLRKPSVVFRIGALLLSVLMFAMISNQAWQPNMEGQEYCIINNSDTACQFPNVVAVIAFLASIGFLVGEFFFDEMSSVKSRKHFVVADLAFSGFWTAAYILSFLTMLYEWTESEDPISGFGQGSVRAAIICSFLSIYAWLEEVQTGVRGGLQ